MKDKKQSIWLLCIHKNWSYSILNYLKSATRRLFTKKYKNLLLFEKSFLLDKSVTKDVFHIFKTSTVFVSRINSISLSKKKTTTWFDIANLKNLEVSFKGSVLEK